MNIKYATSAFVLWIGLAFAAVAEKPYASIRVSSISRVQQIASTLAQHEIGGDQLVRQIDQALSTYGGMLDIERPIGALLVPSKEAADFVFFLPVRNGSTITQTLTALGVTPSPDENGIVEANLGRRFFLLPMNEWCYVASAKEYLKSLPADPTTVARDSNDQADLIVTVEMQEIPTPLKTYTLNRIESWFSNDRLEDSFTRIVPKLTARGLAVSELSRATANSDRCSFKVSLDASANVDCRIAFAGQAIQQVFAGDSKLHGFHLDDAQASGSYRTRLSEEQLAWISHWNELVRGGFTQAPQNTSIRQDDGKKLVNRMVGDGLEMIESIVTRGEIDIAFVSTKTTNVFGVQTRNANETIKKLVIMAKQVQKAGGPIRNFEISDKQIDGSSIYTFSVPVDVLGVSGRQAKLDGWVDVAATATGNGLWLATGGQSAQTLLQIANNGPRKTGPIHGRFSLASSDTSVVRVSSIRNPNEVSIDIKASRGVFQGLFGSSSNTLTGEAAR